MSGWKPQYILPSPFTVFDRLWTDMHTAEFWNAINVTMQRAVKGYTLALIIGSRSAWPSPGPGCCGPRSAR